jgi:hypothetical protein
MLYVRWQRTQPHNEFKNRKTLRVSLGLEASMSVIVWCQQLSNRFRPTVDSFRERPSGIGGLTQPP